MLSVLATASAVSSTFAGMVDVAASGAIPAQPGVGQWTFRAPLSDHAAQNDRDIWGGDPTSNRTREDLAASSQSHTSGGLILYVPRPGSFPPVVQGALPTPDASLPQSGGSSSNPVGPRDDDARALALPDAIHMFPMGAAVAAFAIRRMRRSTGRA
jgi:hypothetical protein